MDIKRLRYENEPALFSISAFISALVWAGLVIGTLGIGLIYLLIGAAIYLIIHALFIAGVKGNGIRITKDQFPELHARIVNATQKLGLSELPQAYLLNYRGMFNAFATRYLGRNFVVLFTELLEHAEEHEGAVDFIVGHEVAHHALGHLKWNAFLFPAKLIPLLGPAYSRACEYSCDFAALEVAGKPEAAVSGLAVLAAGGRYAKALNIEQYLKQRLETGRFWMAVLELGMSHPYLCKRVGGIYRRFNPSLVPAVGRNPFAYILAPFFGFAAAGSGTGTVIAVVAVIGILAAIAVPSFMKYQKRAQEARAKSEQIDALQFDPSPQYSLKGLDDLRTRAEKLYFEGYVSRNFNPRAAAEKWQIVMQIVPPGNEWHEKAKIQLELFKQQGVEFEKTQPLGEADSPAQENE